MRKIDIGQSIQILANVAVLASIVVLGIELRQNTRAVELAAAQSYLAGGSDLDLRIATDPQLAALLIRSSGSEPLSATEALQMERWNYAVFRQWETAYYLRSIDALDENLWLAYRNEIRTILLRSSHMIAYWSSSRGSFATGFASEIDAILNGASRP